MDTHAHVRIHNLTIIIAIATYLLHSYIHIIWLLISAGVVVLIDDATLLVVVVVVVAVIEEFTVLTVLAALVVVTTTFVINIKHSVNKDNVHFLTYIHS